MASFAPQEGLPFPVWHRHVHADSNCSMREVLLWLHSACGCPIIRAPHSAHVHGRLPPPPHGLRRAPLPLVQRRPRCLHPRQNTRRPQGPPIKPPALLGPGNKSQTARFTLRARAVLLPKPDLSVAQLKGAWDTSLISSTNYWSAAQSDDWTVFVGAWLFACVNGVFALASGCDALLRKCQLPRLHHRQHSGLPLSRCCRPSRVGWSRLV